MSQVIQLNVPELYPIKESEALVISPLSLYSPIQGLFIELRAPHCMDNFHWHNHIEVNILYSGRVEYLVNGEHIWLESGQVGVFWAAVPHKITSVEGEAKIGIVNIPVHQFLSWPLDEKFSSYVMNGCFIVSDQRHIVTEGECARWQMCCFGENTGLQQITREEVSLFIRRVCLTGWHHRVNIKCDTFKGTGITHTLQFNVRQMLSYIATHHHKSIQVSDVAESVGLHANYAMNLFQKVMRMSIKKYINTMKLNHACALLSDTQKSIYDIGITCGFQSSSRFYDQFKTTYGMTPKQYRIQTRKSVN